IVAGCGGGGGGVAPLGIAEALNDLALSPGAFWVRFHPTVPLGTDAVTCTASLSGGAERTVTITAAEMTPVAMLRGQADVRLPVPEGVAGSRTITCTATWTTAAGEHVETLSFPVRIEAPQPAPTRELRAAWTRLDNIGDAEDLMSRMAAAGLNAVFIRVRRGETAYYESAVGPLTQIAAGGASLPDCIAAARRHGIEPHVYLNCFIIGQPNSRFALQLRAGNRWQRDAAGSPVPWLCPSVEANVEIIRQGMLELARDYDIAGIQYDFIRYPDKTTCCCSNCRQAFEQSIGAEVAYWPPDVLEGGELREAYQAFRREQITRVVREITPAVRALRPGITVSAAVVDPSQQAADICAQDWVAWCREGLVDAVCPMTYMTDSDEYEARVREVLARVGGSTRVYPGIGLETFRQRMYYPEELAAQLNVLRRLGAPGFVMFAIIPPTDVDARVLLPLRDTALAGDGRG
ncbi:MAG TPA: family 10 glycosylhydrolase, partial [Armatimonadota bacterium]|nr:family 10 glycosylhydrolase [Armatimonadota bacterium]